MLTNHKKRMRIPVTIVDSTTLQTIEEAQMVEVEDDEVVVVAGTTTIIVPFVSCVENQVTLHSNVSTVLTKIFRDNQALITIMLISVLFLMCLQILSGYLTVEPPIT